MTQDDQGQLNHPPLNANSFVPPKGRRTIPLREVVLPHECPEPVRRRVLGRAPYFQGLDTSELSEISTRMNTRVYAPNEHIYNAGDEANELFVIAEGRVKLSQVSADGTATLTDILVPGDLFGAMGALGQPTHLQSATALVPCCILRIGQHDFRQILEQHPKVALKVLDDVAGRLRRAQQDIGDQSTNTVKQRVATTLLRLAHKLGEQTAEGILLNVPLSRADLAGLARSTPESVSRVMSQFKKQNVVDSGRRWTILLNPEALTDATQAVLPPLSD